MFYVSKDCDLCNYCSKTNLVLFLSVSLYRSAARQKLPSRPNFSMVDSVKIVLQAHQNGGHPSSRNDQNT